MKRRARPVESASTNKNREKLETKWTKTNTSGISFPEKKGKTKTHLEKTSGIFLPVLDGTPKKTFAMQGTWANFSKAASRLGKSVGEAQLVSMLLFFLHEAFSKVWFLGSTKNHFKKTQKCLKNHLKNPSISVVGKKPTFPNKQFPTIEVASAAEEAKQNLEKAPTRGWGDPGSGILLRQTIYIYIYIYIYGYILLLFFVFFRQLHRIII